MINIIRNSNNGMMLHQFRTLDEAYSYIICEESLDCTIEDFEEHIHIDHHATCRTISFKDAFYVIRDGGQIEFEIRLPVGFIDGNTSDDPEYPGIDLEYVPSFETEENPTTRPRVMMEMPMETRELSAMIWSNPNSEDYSEKITFENP